MSKGVQGNFAAQVRVFAHDAVSVTPGAAKIANTDQRGVCLYIGGAGNVKVTMESGTTQTFKNVSAGTFLPILVTHVLSAGADPTTATGILALY